ncbi:MAG TPA: hypothetical protein DEP66_05035 [Acidimicrobiaceae bacterium]|nr:hypothetical protein [Acidimicrobiaceae bacterium]
MKTQDTFAAVRAHADLYRCLPVVCFQNGVSNEEWLTDQGFCAYGAMVRIGAFVDRPGVVCHTAGRLALLGRWPGGVDPLCRAVVDDLARGGLDAAVETDIRAVKWGKLVINLVNAYLALADLSVQDSLHDPDVRSFMADVEQEAADVTEAAGITVSIDGETGLRGRIARLRRPAARVLRTGGAWSGVSYASTWQDLKAGRPTVEVDHFNGRIVELGEQHGIATPLNRVLRERCTDAAARGLGPGTETEASIRAAAAG